MIGRMTIWIVVLVLGIGLFIWSLAHTDQKPSIRPPRTPVTVSPS